MIDVSLPYDLRNETLVDIGPVESMARRWDEVHATPFPQTLVREKVVSVITCDINALDL